jgi:hypothetical protein
MHLKGEPYTSAAHVRICAWGVSDRYGIAGEASATTTRNTNRLLIPREKRDRPLKEMEICKIIE